MQHAAITTTERAQSLRDLTSDEFRIIATRDNYKMVWEYCIPAGDVKIYRFQRDHGIIIAPQRREPDGTTVVLAKLATR